jgi:hypothetical protein
MKKEKILFQLVIAKGDKKKRYVIAGKDLPFFNFNQKQKASAIKREEKKVQEFLYREYHPNC